MTKDEMEVFLINSINLSNETLKKEVVKEVLTAYELDYSDWEQLRFIKQKLDTLWKELKKCSEMRVVKEKVQRMVDAFPRPKMPPKK